LVAREKDKKGRGPPGGRLPIGGDWKSAMAKAMKRPMRQEMRRKAPRAS